MDRQVKDSDVFEPTSSNNAKQQAALVEWLNAILPELSLPINALDEELRAFLVDGSVLCRILNKLKPGCVTQCSGSVCSSENVQRFLTALDEMGLPRFQQADLEKGSMKIVLDCLLTLQTHFTLNGSVAGSRRRLSGEHVGNVDGTPREETFRLLPSLPFGEDKRKLAHDSKVQRALRSTIITEPSAAVINHVGHKFHEVFQLKQGSYRDLPAAKISEMMKSNSLDNAPTQSLLSVVNGILDESIERKHGEIPHRVACLLRKVVQEIERRICTQAEHLRTQNNLFKAREEKYQSRIRVLEALATGTSEETQIVMNQLQQIKSEKNKTEEKKKVEEQDISRLTKEKDDLNQEITNLGQEIATLRHELEIARKSCELKTIETKVEVGRAQQEYGDRLREALSSLTESRNRVKELEDKLKEAQAQAGGAQQEHEDRLKEALSSLTESRNKVKELEDKLREAQTEAGGALQEHDDRLKEALSSLTESRNRVKELEDKLKEAQAKAGGAQQENEDRLKEALSSLTESRNRVKELEDKLKEALSSLADSRSRMKELEDRLKEAQSLLTELRNRVKELEAFLESKSEWWNKKQHIYQIFTEFQLGALRELKFASQSIRQEVVGTQKSYLDDFAILGSRIKTLDHAVKSYYSLLTENQKLHNELQELKGNIRVYCRIRPFLPGQKGKQSVVEYIGENGELIVVNPSKQGKEGRRSFKFDKVYGSTATQAEVFVDTQPLTQSVLDGYNVCIFAYGQTGSGKTYTMTGPDGASEEEWGVNYRALNNLFRISQSREGTFTYEISVQMVEIYNEQVRDLLSNDTSQKKLGILSATQSNGLAVPDATINPVNSTSDVLKLMDIGLKNRAKGSTAMNERSSRSHSIVSIHVRGTDLKSGSSLRGSLHLVDLAGSERVDRSEVTGDRLREAQHINKSLSALGDVIFALAQKSSHVPYRNSKLTQVLQSSLGGHAKTLMFVQLNPDSTSYTESISTLKFAERVSGVELGAAKSSKDGRDVASLKDTIAKKDEEIETLQLLKDPKNWRGFLGNLLVF